MSRARRAVRRAVPAVVSGAALAFLLAAVDVESLRGALSWRAVRLLTPALGAYGAVTLLLEALCLVRLLEGAAKRSGQELGIPAAARIKCASYLLGTLHYALGVAALTLLLRRRAAIPLSDAATAVLLVSSADLLVLLAFATAGASALGMDLPLAGALAAVAAGGAGGLALLRTRTPLRALERVRSLAALQALRRVPLSRLAELLGLRLLFACAFVGLAGAAFAAFDLYPALPRLVVGMMIVAAVAALPIAVAGLGTGQVAFLAVFRGVAEPGALLAVSLLLSAGMIGLRVAMGLVFAREFSWEALAASRAEGP